MPNVISVMNKFELNSGKKVAGYRLTTREGKETHAEQYYTSKSSYPHKKFFYTIKLSFVPTEDAFSEDVLQTTLENTLLSDRQVNHRGHWYTVHLETATQSPKYEPMTVQGYKMDAYSIDLHGWAMLTDDMSSSSSSSHEKSPKHYIKHPSPLHSSHHSKKD
jgi:hypothetical protein